MLMVDHMDVMIVHKQLNKAKQVVEILRLSEPANNTVWRIQECHVISTLGDIRAITLESSHHQLPYLYLALKVRCHQIRQLSLLGLLSAASPLGYDYKLAFGRRHCRARPQACSSKALPQDRHRPPALEDPRCQTSSSLSCLNVMGLQPTPCTCYIYGTHSPLLGYSFLYTFQHGIKLVFFSLHTQPAA